MPQNATLQYIRPDIDFSALAQDFRGAKPFDHVVIDDFFLPEVAGQLAADFPAFNGEIWHEYRNAIEIKKVSNRWDQFPKLTYAVFHYLNSPEFVAEMAKLPGAKLFADPGLHGGGWHLHAAGGKLNTHLDYSIHPKLGLERRLNIIIYMTPDWKPEWNGALGLWDHDAEGNKAALVREVPCVFNRAVIFDTSQHSWHGLPDPVTCPPGVSRNSMAAYYLCEPRAEADSRGRALFAPHGEQEKDPAVLELIRKRSQVNTSAEVYRQQEEPAGVK